MKKIIINDYSGHPFQVQLSRQLAKNDYEVLHLYSVFFQTPKGKLRKEVEDGDHFNVEGLRLKDSFQKNTFIKRKFQEQEYGKLVIEQIKTFQPDIIVNSNNPMDALRVIDRFTSKNNIKTVYWWHDIYGLAISKIVRKKIPGLGHFIGWYYIKLEKRILKNAHHIIGISDEFPNVLENWKIPLDKYTTIPNWAPLDEIIQAAKDNAWARATGIAKTTNIIYTGTLGFKHNPQVLIDLALHFKDVSNIKIIVSSEGWGADFLKQKKEELRLENLIIMPFQPFEDYANVLGSADILIAILEPDAGVYSVPSKVLSYLCSGRPVLLSVPKNNLAAKIIKENNCGFVSEPQDVKNLLQNAEKLINDIPLRSKFSVNARKYAETHFNIKKISIKFADIFDNL